MFFAGMETDVEQFKKAGASAFIIAILAYSFLWGLGPPRRFLFSTI
jgi:Kef-type K+ transport system membrane component KefB